MIGVGVRGAGVAAEFDPRSLLGPSLDLQFLRGSLDPAITFTRASTATYFDAAGVLRSAANNVPRIDYNPSTLVAQGLLIEESRTNSIRNNTMQGAVAGTPGTLPTNWQISGSGAGTLSRDIVGSGVASGIAYIDIRYYGTTSTIGLTISCEPNAGGPAASAGQTWTGSAYVAIVGGSVSNLNSIRAVVLTGRTSLGASTTDAVNSGDQRSALTATMQRFSVTLTLADATTATLQTGTSLAFSSGVAIDITLRIGLPQLEQGAFATSVIPTTTTALTRSADVAAVNTLSPWFNATEGTIFTNFILQNPPAINLGSVYAISNGTINERILVTMGSGAGGNINALVGTGGVTQAQTINGGLTTAGAYRYANAYKVNDFASVVNGGASVTDASGNVPVVDRLILGANQVGAAFFNGWIQRITYYPRRVSNAELQALTA